MILIKLLTSLIVFKILYLVQDFIFFEPFLAIIKLGTLTGVSWFAGSRIVKLINRLLPIVCPKNKAVLISGKLMETIRTRHLVFLSGCASGFGHLTALRLNELGFYVFSTCRDEKSIGATDLLNKAKFPDRMKIIQLDVTKEIDVLNAVKIVNQVLNQKKLELHAIVNNAGIIEVGGIEWAENGPSVGDYRRAMEVNCFGVIRVTRGFLSLLRLSRGRVVNISSTMSRTNYPGINQYFVSKAASVKFTEGLQAEIVQYGVIPISIEPWFYRTPLLNATTVTSSLREKWEIAAPEVRSDYGDEYFEAMIEGSLFTVNSPHWVIDSPEDVTRAVEEAVSSMLPEPVYRVITPGFGLIFWILHDLLPYDLSFILRRIQHWFTIKFLA